MALLHTAVLTPTKIELLRAWLPGQPWSGADAEQTEIVGNYRFDDPDGEVGVETILLQAGDGPVLQVPLTYRAAPREDATAGLITTLDHSVLGPRWVYDGCTDPVYAATLAYTIVTGGRQADLDVQTNTGLQRREPTTLVWGSGTPGASLRAIDSLTATTTGTSTTINTGSLDLIVHRVVGDAETTADQATLTGVWPGRAFPALLALARMR